MPRSLPLVALGIGLLIAFLVVGHGIRFNAD
jgi:hypothetical protein